MGDTVSSGCMYIVFYVVSFMLSGNGVEWYFRGENNQYSLHCTHPLTRMLSKNWGSVSGGAFLNAFVGWL